MPLRISNDWGFKRKEIYTGKGAEDKLEILARFIDMLFNGSKTPLIPALIAGAKALALGAGSGAAGWGAKKALDTISGSGCKKTPEKGVIKIGK
ncbi:hypothetical protein TNIN_287721 [Trichonephila inaurata madagascariensis]|uniref:Uncharacterized protein n=1 Tax=Trichonephila inaurata madagascariensis TaxID=2747483 RepID=A0A8X6Y8M4_9ARAC|nr:hypothetical protein TNIN_287721 [Trichonephila inaurata madagascariensis]